MLVKNNENLKDMLQGLCDGLGIVMDVKLVEPASVVIFLDLRPKGKQYPLASINENFQTSWMQFGDGIHNWRVREGADLKPFYDDNRLDTLLLFVMDAVRRSLLSLKEVEPSIKLSVVLEKVNTLWRKELDL